MKIATRKFSKLDRVFRAFADPTRLRILCLLTRGETCVCDIVEALRMPQPTVSRHLAYLRGSNLVQVRREGLWMHYKLAPAKDAVHRKLLECLSCCFADIPEIRCDCTRISVAKKKRGCCG